MEDIYSALLNDAEPDTAALAASLRKKEGMGTLAALTGIGGLQRLGPQMVAEAGKGAQDFATLRDRNQNLALSRAIALQNHLDSVNQAATNEQDRNDRAKDSADLRRELQQNAIDARTKAVDDKNSLAAEKKAEAANAALAAYDHMIEQAQKIHDNPALSRITGFNANLPNIPGFAGADVDADLHSLTSASALTALQALRAGGATLGRVTNMEMGLLQNSVAPLAAKQTLEAKRKALEDFIRTSKASRDRIAAAGGLDPAYADDTADPAAPPAPGQPPQVGTRAPAGAAAGSRLPLTTARFPGQAQPGDNPIEHTGSAAYIRDIPGSSPVNNPADNAPALVRVNSLAEAAKLTPGTHFLTPDGREKIR